MDIHSYYFKISRINKTQIEVLLSTGVQRQKQAQQAELSLQVHSIVYTV